MADLAFELAAGRVVFVEHRDEEVLSFEFVYDLGDDADAGVGGRNGAMAAVDVQVKDYVEGPFFANAWEGVDDAVIFVADSLDAHAAFVEDEFEAVVAVPLLEIFGDGASAEESVGLLVEAKSEDYTASRLPVLM